MKNLQSGVACCHLSVAAPTLRRAKKERSHCLGHARRSRRTRLRGTVLPIVLLISAMMLATSAAWFETTLAAARGTTNVGDYLQAFHAADSALNLCARSVIASAGNGAPSQSPPFTASEPVQWKAAATFEPGAISPIAQWPGSLHAPQCLIEAWRLATRADAQAYLVTSRGFGRSKDSQVWLQMELVIDDGKLERHWRRVVARPF